MFVVVPVSFLQSNLGIPWLGIVSLLLQDHLRDFVVVAAVVDRVSIVLA